MGRKGKGMDAKGLDHPLGKTRLLGVLASSFASSTLTASYF
jgi:hypothetical protein